MFTPNVFEKYNGVFYYELYYANIYVNKVHLQHNSAG